MTNSNLTLSEYIEFKANEIIGSMISEKVNSILSNENIDYKIKETLEKYLVGIIDEHDDDPMPPAEAEITLDVETETLVDDINKDESNQVDAGYVLVEKSSFKKNDHASDFSITETLNNGRANIILTEGNLREAEEGKPDGQTSRVINPRGIAPCLTTNGSVYVDVRELECGETKEIVQPENKPMKKPGRKGVPVLQFNLEGECIKEWESSSMAEASLKMSHQSIGKAARGMNNHKACGFLWYKKDDPEVIIYNAA